MSDAEAEGGGEASTLGTALGATAARCDGRGPGVVDGVLANAVPVGAGIAVPVATAAVVGVPEIDAGEARALDELATAGSLRGATVDVGVGVAVEAAMAVGAASTSSSDATAARNDRRIAT